MQRSPHASLQPPTSTQGLACCKRSGAACRLTAGSSAALPQQLRFSEDAELKLQLKLLSLSLVPVSSENGSVTEPSSVPSEPRFAHPTQLKYQSDDDASLTAVKRPLHATGTKGQLLCYPQGSAGGALLGSPFSIVFFPTVLLSDRKPFPPQRLPICSLCPMHCFLDILMDRGHFCRKALYTRPKFDLSLVRLYNMCSLLLYPPCV